MTVCEEMIPPKNVINSKIYFVIFGSSPEAPIQYNLKLWSAVNSGDSVVTAEVKDPFTIFPAS